MVNAEAKLAELVERLRKAHQDCLVSVVLYGSAASGDNQAGFSDLNVLCVLNQVTPQELEQAEPVLRWWRAQGNLAPLLLSEREVQASTDCFPMEYHDMQESRRVLFGRDVIADLIVDRSFYHAEVEHELRGKLLRLRQQGAGLLKDKKALLRLMAESVSTFLVLARHCLLLAGISSGPGKRATAAKLAEIGVSPSPFEKLLDVRERKSREAAPDARALFEDYLRQIDSLAAFVDRLEKGAGRVNE